MKALAAALVASIALSSAAALAQDSASDETAIYRVRQTVTLDQIDRDADNVSMWVSLPGDERHQDVLDLSVVSAPGSWSIVEDAERRGRFLRIDVRDPKSDSLGVVVDFTIRRDSVEQQIDPDRAGPISSATRNALAPYLRHDSAHMEVTPAIRKMADEVCGKETNVAVQATMLLAHVAASVDHYSKDPTKPSCGVGDAAMCLSQGGGCCTDLHSLFISLARARSIPARLQMGYRLLHRNFGKDVDPGYRCWVEYFVPGYGWVSADIVEADAVGGRGPARWLTGLTNERLWLNEGRDFRFEGARAETPVNHMSIAYAEIDGTPARLLPEGDLQPQIKRRIRFTRVADGKTAAIETAAR